MKRRNILIMSLLVLFMTTGCKVTYYKKYNYKNITEDMGWAVLRQHFFGTVKKIDECNSVIGSPYELIVAFDPKDPIKTSCFINIDSIKLIDKETGHTVLNKKSLKSNFERASSDGEHFAFFSIQNILMDYNAHDLILNFTLSEECYGEEIKGEKVFVFEKDYEEDKITFWDALMGV